MLSTFFAILFAFKCIISKRKSIHSYIRSKYSLNVLTQVRSWEKLKKRLIKAELDTTFLNTCIKYDFVPPFMKFKLYRRSLYNSSWYNRTTRHILQMEVQFKQSTIENIRKEYNLSTNQLYSKLSVLDRLWITRVVNSN